MYYYSLFDKKTNVFDSLIALETKEVAAVTRWFSTVLNSDTLVKQNAMLARYPEDFDLYYIGEFSLELGEFMEEKQFVCNAGQLITRTEEVNG